MDSHPAQGAIPAPLRASTRHAITNRFNIDAPQYLTAPDCDDLTRPQGSGKIAAIRQSDFPGRAWRRHSNDRVEFRGRAEDSTSPRYTRDCPVMRRFLAVLALLALTSHPVARVMCAWTCANPEALATSESCHDENGPEPAVRIGADHCDGTNVPVPPTAKLTGGLVFASLELADAQPGSESAASAAAPLPTGAVYRATANRLIPLRI